MKCFNRGKDVIEFLWLMRPLIWWVRVLEYGAYLAIIFLILISLTGCSIVKYEAKSDGSTVASGYVLGTNQALDGVSFKTDGKARSLHINSADSNQTEGMRQVNQLVQAIVSGVVAGMK